MPLARLPWPCVCALTRPGISSRSPASIATASSGAARPGGPIAAMVSPAISKSAGGAVWPAMSRRRPLRMTVWAGSAIALAQEVEMRLSRLEVAPVDRDDVLRAGREGDDEVHLGAQADMAARRRDRRLEGEGDAARHRNIHEQVERRWRLRRLEAERLEPGGEVVGAAVVKALDPQPLVAIAVAGRHQRVVDAARIILDEGQDRAAMIGQHGVARRRYDLEDAGAAVLHRHEFGDVGAIEGPGVDDLLAVRVDDLDDLSFGDEGGLALARRNGDFRHGQCFLLGLDSERRLAPADRRRNHDSTGTGTPVPIREAHSPHGCRFLLIAAKNTGATLLPSHPKRGPSRSPLVPPAW